VYQLELYLLILLISKFFQIALAKIRAAESIEAARAEILIALPRRKLKALLVGLNCNPAAWSSWRI